MATEYKLSYTAEEIDNRLGKVASISEDVDSLQSNVGVIQGDVGSLQTDVGTLQTDIQSKAEIIQLSTAEFEALGGDANENTLYMLTDADEEADASVLYTEQLLTDAQKSQARINIGAGSPQVQSDWGQNDEGQPDYVKNRTHWTDDPVEAPVFEGQSFDISFESFSNDGEGTIYFGEGVEVSSDFVIGCTYVVYFNGTPYECIASLDEFDEFTIYIGNQSILENGTVGNGEPFVIRCSGRWIEVYTVTSGIYTVSINEFQTTYHTIDERYIPDTIARDSVKQDVLSGTVGQYVGFDTDNKAKAVTPSWNDLADRPFEQHVITWDGDTTNKVSVVYADNDTLSAIYIKVSDKILDYSQILRATLQNGAQLNSFGAITEFENGYSYSTGSIGSFCCIYEDNTEFTYRKTKMTFPEAGFYICNYAGVVSGYISEVLYFEHIFDEKYLPDTVQRTITGTAGQFVVIGDDGNVTTRTIPYAEEASF